MPKIKTRRAAAKRFKFTATGKIKRGKAYKRHLLESKGSSQKRRLSKMVVLNKKDTEKVKQMLPYGN